MSKKYIGQQQNNNFVYPNNELTEYDVEIIHDVNNNMVSGTVTNLVAAITNGNQSIALQFDYNWIKNGAEPSFLSNGQLSLISLHLLTPTQKYFKPWTCVYNLSTTATTSNTVSGTATTTIPFGYTLVEGVYVLEFRFIAHRCIFPVIFNAQINYAPLTPTPTATPTSTPNPCILVGTVAYQ